jgi:HD-GYP domain-containing protein (c-di-GMP phosphodiesterase class II)
VCCLSARRLGWSDAERRTLVSAGLTMNVSMIELQGRLAVQATPPSADQRAQIESHPARSVEMLEAAGITDADWLAAVAQHHERADGTGYPNGLTDLGQLARALQYADVFTAKLSARSTRAPLPPDRAARDLFQRSGGHPLAAALVKEFGIYPPGCFVRLASGEIAIVVHRGETVNTPVVACLTKPSGQQLVRPARRETTARDSAVVAIVPETDVMVRVSWESLYADD